MKSSSSQLTAHIAGETTTLATCWKVTRKDGDVFGFTDFDRDLTIDGLVYEAWTGYTRSAIHTISDLSVDNLDIESALDSDAFSMAERGGKGRVLGVQKGGVLGSKKKSEARLLTKRYPHVDKSGFFLGWRRCRFLFQTIYLWR